jgi:hypothetical protein
VDAEPGRVLLGVTVPAAFGANASLTHTRVDHSHGDAFTVWESQGRPATPSATQLAALRAAMEPVVLERERVVEVADGAVRLPFDLPRFGISLVTISPSDIGPRETSRTSETGCSCRLATRAQADLPALLAFAFVAELARRRRLFARS